MDKRISVTDEKQKYDYIFEEPKIPHRHAFFDIYKEGRRTLLVFPLSTDKDTVLMAAKAYYKKSEKDIKIIYGAANKGLLYYDNVLTPTRNVVWVAMLR